VSTTASPIRVTCPSCDSSFPVDPRKVPAEGVDAICSSCRSVFHVPGGGDAQEAALDSAHGEVDPMAPSAPATDTEAVEDDDWDSFGDMVFEPEEGEVGTAEPASEGPAPDDGDLVPFDTPMDAIDFQQDTAPEPASGEAESPAEAEAPAEAPAPRAFGRRDPHERAARLARVLVSDMIVYHKDKYERALEAGTLVADFEEEIEKSRAEYVDQVGQEIADGTSYFRDALNEILARGEQLY
jgi:predicted Zn finger-like uncharacterized protein